MNKKTGGPAFPEQIAVTPTGDTYSGEAGMTLRDYFAAHFLQGCAAHPTTNYKNHVEAALDAYKMADAMLAARSAA